MSDIIIYVVANFHILCNFEKVLTCLIETCWEVKYEAEFFLNKHQIQFVFFFQSANNFCISAYFMLNK